MIHWDVATEETLKAMRLKADETKSRESFDRMVEIMEDWNWQTEVRHDIPSSETMCMWHWRDGPRFTGGLVYHADSNEWLLHS